MNGVDIGLTALRVLVKLIPPPKPEPVDYSDVRSVYDDFHNKRMAIHKSYMTPRQAQSEPVAEVIVEQEPEIKQLPERATGEVATSCIACSRSHMATIAGALDESMRFAREGGVTDPEVLRRLDVAEREINIMERIDLSPEAIQNSPPKDQAMAREFLPKIRRLRQDIGQITSVDQLERTASDASILTHEFRLRQMEQNGANLNPIIELAKRVQAGEISMEEARQQVKQYLPKEG
jgi:hypothetical protein